MAEEKTDTPSEEGGTTEEEKGNTTRSLHNPLSRPTDAVIRPGFRNPANTRSKASKKKKRKKRR